MQITRYRIETEKIKEPITIALLADTHNKPCDGTAAALAALRPALILIAGDFFYGSLPEPDESGNAPLKIRDSVHTVELFKICADTAPAFASLGNHEWMISSPDLDYISSLGINVLDNSYALHKNLLIGGLTSAYVTDYRAFKAGYRRLHPDDRCLYPRRPAAEKQRGQHSRRLPRIPDYTWLDAFENQNGFKILLSHHPEYWALQEPMLGSRRIDAVFSGHCHGGQWRLRSPISRRHSGVFAPNQGFFPKYTEGLHKSGTSSLIISRGLANTTWIPRINNDLELLAVEIKEL